MSVSKQADFFDKVDVSVSIAKLVFSFLQENYPCKTINQIAETTSGGTPLRGHPDYYGGNIPWIKSGELNDGLITSYEETITEEGLKNSSAKIYPRGTLVLALYGATAGKTGIVDFDTASNQAVAAIYPNKEIERDYLFWFFRQKRFEYIQMSFGAAQPNISQAVVKATLVPVPPKTIQKEVVNFLYSCERTNQLVKQKSLEPIWDKVISFYNVYINRQILIKELDQQQFYLQLLRQTILQEAVQGKLTKQGAADEPASELLKRIKAEKQKLLKEGFSSPSGEVSAGRRGKKEKELPPISGDEIPFELPKGWVWCRLGEITDLISGVTLGKTYKEELFEVPYLRVANVQRGYIDISHVKIIKVPRYEIEKYNLQNGDLCMIEGGDWDKVGRCGIWKNEISPCIHQNHIFRLRFYGGISNQWSEMFLNSPVARKYFESCSKQTTNLASINKTQLTSLLYALPPLPEQQRIVTKVQQLQQQLNALETQVQQSGQYAQQLLQAVLKEAFEGNKKEYATNEQLTMAAEN